MEAAAAEDAALGAGVDGIDEFVEAVFAAGAGGVKPAKLIPEKLGNWILVESRSSISGKSSSLAEYLPPFGLVARELAAD